MKLWFCQFNVHLDIILGVLSFRSSPLKDDVFVSKIRSGRPGVSEASVDRVRDNFT